MGSIFVANRMAFEKKNSLKSRGFEKSALTAVTWSQQALILVAISLFLVVSPVVTVTPVYIVFTLSLDVALCLRHHDVIRRSTAYVVPHCNVRCHTSKLILTHIVSCFVASECCLYKTQTIFSLYFCRICTT